MRFLSTATLAVLALCLATSCSKGPAPGQSPFKVVPVEQIDKAQQEAAEQIAFRTLSAWRDGKFESLGDDFSDIMKQSLTPQTQRQSHESVGFLGEFKSLEFAEALSSDIPDAVAIYRFKGDFSDVEHMPEVRVVMDIRGKVNGFWIKPWMDQMQ